MSIRKSTVEAQPYQGEIHKKAWGYENWIINNELYCGKLLVFKKDKQFSMHYHLLKDEAWYISKGEFIYKWIDTENASEQETIVKGLNLKKKFQIRPKHIHNYCKIQLN